MANDEPQENWPMIIGLYVAMLLLLAVVAAMNVVG